MFLDMNNVAYQGNVLQKGAYTAVPASYPVHHWVSCFWQLNVGLGGFVYRSVPDNCIDWIINLDNVHDNFVVSPFSTAIEFPIEGPTCYFGIRFKLLAYQGFIATPIGEWNTPEHTIASDEIIPPLIVEQIAETLQNTVSLNERCAVVSSVLLAHLSLPILDRRLERFAQCAMHADQVDINNFGVSARQLRRLSQLYLGLSIKDYLKVIRFQKTLHLMNTQGDHNAWLDHYYDQAHFSKEFKSLAGLPPKKFLKMSVLYNK